MGYNPKDNLQNTNSDIQETSKICYNCDYKILENILKNKNALLGGRLPEDEGVRRGFIDNLYEYSHKGKRHDQPLTIRKLQDFGFNIEKSPDYISKLLSAYVDSAKAEILSNQKRVLFETKSETISRYPQDSDFI